MKKVILTLLALCSFSVLSADGSNTVSKGSAQTSQGSIVLSEGISEVMLQAGSATVEFTVSAVQTAADVMIITLIPVAESGVIGSEVTLSIASAAFDAASIAVGHALQLMVIYEQEKQEILGYLVMKSQDVLFFVAEQNSPVTLYSEITP